MVHQLLLLRRQHVVQLLRAEEGSQGRWCVHGETRSVCPFDLEVWSLGLLGSPQTGKPCRFVAVQRRIEVPALESSDSVFKLFLRWWRHVPVMTGPSVEGKVFEAVVILALESLAKEADSWDAWETSGFLDRLLAP